MYLLNLSPKVSGLVVFVLHTRGVLSTVVPPVNFFLFPTTTNSACVPTLGPYYPLPCLVKNSIYSM